MRMMILPGALLVLAGVAACGDPGATPQSIAEVTDSAGVRIVTSDPGDAVYAAVAEQAALSIGLLDGPPELLFGRIASVARDERGNLIVADRQANEIRVFDAEGAHLRTLGREGEGPGEFQGLNGAWPVPGGGIVATDNDLDRITHFDPDGARAGTARFAGLEEDEISFTSITPTGLGGPGMLLSLATLTSMPSLTSTSGTMEEVMEEMFAGQSPVSYVRHRLDGTMVDTLAPGREPTAAISLSGSGTGGVMRITPLPFSPQSAAAGSAHGLVVTGGVRYEIRVFDAEGSLRMAARLAEEPPVRTDEHLRAYATGSGRSERDDEEIRQRLERYREMSLPESLPGYTDVLIADTGELWALRYRLPGVSIARWDVFADDGAYLGRVDVPASLQPEEVSRGQILGIATDDLGVQRVEIRDLVVG